MCMEDIKLFAKKNEKKWRVIQITRIYFQDIRMEFDIEKFAMQ